MSNKRLGIKDKCYLIAQPEVPPGFLYGRIVDPNGYIVWVAILEEQKHLYPIHSYIRAIGHKSNTTGPIENQTFYRE